MNALFSHEWQRMQDTLQRIAEESRARANELSRWREDPETQALILERDTTKKKLLGLEQEVYLRKSFIRHINALLSKVQQCSSGLISKTAAYRASVKDLNTRMVELRRLQASGAALQSYQRIYDSVFRAELSLDEAKKVIEQEKSVVSQQIALLEKPIEAGNQLVKSTDAKIQSKMQKAQEAADKAKEALQRQKDKIGAWIIQSREQAEWVAENAPSYKDVALKFLKPESPQATAPTLTTISHPPKIRQRPEPAQKTEVKPEPWKLFLAGQTNALPQEKREFTQAIGQEVLGKGLPRFKFGSLYDRLMAICYHMTIGERQKELNKIRGGQHDGWKHLAIGDCIVLLEIDEPKRAINIALETREIFRRIWLQE